MSEGRLQRIFGAFVLGEILDNPDHANGQIIVIPVDDPDIDLDPDRFATAIDDHVFQVRLLVIAAQQGLGHLPHLGQVLGVRKRDQGFRADLLIGQFRPAQYIRQRGVQPQKPAFGIQVPDAQPRHTQRHLGAHARLTGFLLDPQLVRDIAQRARNPFRASVRIAQDFAHPLHPEIMALPVLEAEHQILLVGTGIAGFDLRLAQGLLDRRQIIRMHGGQEVRYPAHARGLGIARHLVIAGRGKELVGLEVEIENREVGALDRQLV